MGFRALIGSVAGVALLATACDKPPIAWDDPTSISQPPGATRLTFDGATPRFVADSARVASLPTSAGRCAQGTVVAVGPGTSAAGWWSVRPDSSAVLYVSASADAGETWGTPTAVDTTDVSSNGCRRPPPSVVTVGEDVYVAYSMAAPEGTGVFFAHTMSGMVHSPVPVIYGDRLVPTAIAADAKRVVVAYEQPNGTRRQVDVAISVSQGHLFETHTTASRSVDNATAPMVAMRDSAIAVSWLTRARDESPAARVVRVGRMAPWN
jgi:hypothetical protein